ncbi:hypothetical protein Hanom_Chr10g00945631 [Helianthus anomalus]
MTKELQKATMFYEKLRSFKKSQCSNFLKLIFPLSIQEVILKSPFEFTKLFFSLLTFYKSQKVIRRCGKA